MTGGGGSWNPDKSGLRRLEVRIPMFPDVKSGLRRLEAGSWKLEVGSWKE